MMIRPRTLQDGRPCYELRWELPPDPASGRRRQKFERFHGTRREAERRWLAVQGEIDRAGRSYIEPAKEVLADYLKRWVRDYVKPYLKPTTAESYSTLIRFHIEPSLGAVRLSELTSGAIQSWIAEMQRKTTPTGHPLSARRVAYARTVLRAALQEAVRLGLIAVNPVDRTRPPKQRPREAQAFDRDQVQALSAAARGHRLEALFGLAWQSGLRLGELLAVQWRDIDLEGRTLTVRRNLVEVSGSLIFQSPKTQESVATVGLALVSVETLKAHRARQAAERLATGAAWQDLGLVFCTRRGGPLRPRNVERTWYVLRKRAHLPAFKFHSLRHTYASLGLSAGIPLEVISAGLRHKDFAFTKNTYAHLLPDAKRQAADQFDTYVRGGEPPGKRS